MQKISDFLMFMLLFLIVVSSVGVAGALTVGVKEGDWIEYQVNITGNVPAEHNSTWAKLEVMQIEDSIVNLTVTSGFEGSLPIIESIIINLDAGILGDCFIIPANLKVGDGFFDSRQGNLTIASASQRTVAGSERTLISAATAETVYFWDQITGILVEAHTVTSDFNMTTQATKTNMWQESSPRLVIYAIVVAVILMLITMAFFVFQKKRFVPSI
ncbi:MAG: hypothetical protein N3D85_02040 [Candidatus Bathyarchaeota archaeon]|nr:hypothetical protein [Candidatus Bathyarchaeota archaeon]